MNNVRPDLTDLTVLDEVPFFTGGWWYFTGIANPYRTRTHIKKKDFSGIFYCVVGDHCWKEIKWKTGQGVKKSRIRSYSKDEVYYKDRPEKICTKHENALETAGV